jgi:ATP-binding cassette subfamily B protein
MKAPTQLSYLPRAVSLIWSASRGWMLLWSVLLVAQGLLPSAYVYLTRLLVDSLVIAGGTHGSWDSVRPVLILAVLMGTVALLIQALQGVSDWVRAAQSELVQDYVSGLIHAKSAVVDLAFYESPDYYDHLHRARSDAGGRSLALLENVGSLLQNGVTMLAMAAMLLPFGLWLPALLIISTLPALYVALRFNRREHRWWERTTADRRWAGYYETMLTSGGAAAELRLFDLGARFQAAYRAIRERLRGECLRLYRDQSIAGLAASVVALLISGGAVGWMLWRLLRGQATLGELTLFYQAFSWGQGLMRALLGNLGQIYANSLFLGNLFAFLSLEPHVVDAQEPQPLLGSLNEGIRFEDVSFRYPGSAQLALQQFSLTIPVGQTVAIVGPNGAGKSTLIKLLCRYYDPEAGRITLDGIDIRNLSLRDLRSHITVLFQFPVNYQATAAENIAFSGQELPGQDAIEAAARSAGAHEIIMQLPSQYDTLLGKGFAEGAELSGGEWQRVALARAFLRQAPLVLLDEPTSFMDSWAEAEWLERFRALVRGRTALIVTHRFTTAMRADVIHLVRDGRIVESGSHDELVARGGLYAQSWTAQMHADTLHSPTESLYEF